MARRWHAWALVAIGGYGALLWLAAPPWPDDWDGIGFLESVTDFDLARFRPHPPGYPVYVALLRVAAAFFANPMRACQAVAVAGGMTAVALVWDATRSALGDRSAWVASVFIALAPSVWRACSGVGSESPALACAAACAWGLMGRSRTESARAALLGLGTGLGLGVRLSWAPLYVAALALAPRRLRTRAFGIAAFACALWLVPFLAVVGPRSLLAAYAVHFGGHASRWGGTVVTEPGAVRMFWLARDVLGDGLGVGRDPLGLAIAAVCALVTVQTLLIWHSFHWRGWRVATAIGVPYLVWIALGQNLREQPRHAVPLVAMLCAGLAIGSARRRASNLACGLLVVLVSVRTATDAYTRRTIPPASRQLVDLACGQPSPERLAVFGGGSIRFFEMAACAAKALGVGSLGDAEMALTRVDELPTRAWVTSEIPGVGDTRWRLEPIAVLCRPPRLDRRMPCLRVDQWKLPYLPSK
jgi:hypothetical protein